jgi:hypothetical protein
VANGGGAHGTRPGGAARGDARRISGDSALRVLALRVLFRGQDLQVDGDGLTRRQEDGVRVAARGEAPELVSVGSQEGLTNGAKPVDEEGLRVRVIENFGKE